MKAGQRGPPHREHRRLSRNRPRHLCQRAGYRAFLPPALHALFTSIDPALTVVNEPKKSEAGMPDFLFERGGIPFGWAEAKDIDKDVIRLKGYSVEQR